VNCTLKIMIVRVLLLFLAALPTWSSGHALAAGLDDQAAGDLQKAKRLYKSGKYEEAADLFSQLNGVDSRQAAITGPHARQDHASTGWTGSTRLYSHPTRRPLGSC
jgi:hypothetical protein